jgi:hypothetical protein
VFLRTSDATSSLVAGPKILCQLLSQMGARGGIVLAAATCLFFGATIMITGGLVQIPPLMWSGVGLIGTSLLIFSTSYSRCLTPISTERALEMMAGATMKRNKSDSALNLAIEAEAEAAEP